MGATHDTLLTRLSIFVFLLPWQLMRFSKPESAKGIAAKYYKVSSLPDVVHPAIAVFMMALLIAFLLGFKKRISYGLIFLLHAVGTAFTLPYLIPGTENFNILFMAAIPTIMAMFILYRLREADTISLDSVLSDKK